MEQVSDGGMHCNSPTVMGLIFTPSSTCAIVGSSDSLCERTLRPQRVLTNVVRPGRHRSATNVDGQGCITSARSATDHQAELNTLLHILLPADLDLRLRQPIDIAVKNSPGMLHTAFIDGEDIMSTEFRRARQALKAQDKVEPSATEKK